MAAGDTGSTPRRHDSATRSLRHHTTDHAGAPFDDTTRATTCSEPQPSSRRHHGSAQGQGPYGTSSGLDAGPDPTGGHEVPRHRPRGPFGPARRTTAASAVLALHACAATPLSASAASEGDHTPPQRADPRLRDGLRRVRGTRARRGVPATARRRGCGVGGLARSGASRVHDAERRRLPHARWWPGVDIGVRALLRPTSAMVTGLAVRCPWMAGHKRRPAPPTLLVGRSRMAAAGRSAALLPKPVLQSRARAPLGEQHTAFAARVRSATRGSPPLRCTPSEGRPRALSPCPRNGRA